MKHIFALLAVIMLPAFHTLALTGSWRGDLNFGQTKIPIVFNFTEKADGATNCTLDSPMQGAKGIPVDVLLCTADSVSLACHSIGASFEGKVMSKEIEGTFKQHGYSFPLTLSPEPPIEERRPQTPKPPFPYSVTDTTFTSPDGAVMSATLTMPLNASSKKIPAVVMVTGSGPQNRDEEVFEHKPFAVIADFLARNGIASLRYDDRGTGRSGGNFMAATTETFKKDAGSGIAFMHTIASIGKVGVIGHSEGGTIAFMLGAKGIPDFIVSLAGMAVSGKETILKQNGRGLDQMGLTGADKENSLKLIGLVFDTMIEQSRTGASSPVNTDSIASAAGLKPLPQIAESLRMTQKMRTPWFDAFLDLNPREYLKDVRCPVLAINGDKDTQVEADNLAVIKNLIPQAQAMLMPGLNHLMQHAVTGDANEYGEIRETISPEVLEAIVQFIKNTPPL